MKILHPNQHSIRFIHSFNLVFPLRLKSPSPDFSVCWVLQCITVLKRDLIREVHRTIPLLDINEFYLNENENMESHYIIILPYSI